MTTGNGGPAQPLPPIIMINGEVNEETLKRLGDMISQSAYRGMSKLDIFACAVAQGMVAAGKSTGKKTFGAEAFVGAEKLLAASIASDTITQERSLEFDRMVEENDRLITDNHNLREKMVRMSRSGQIQTKRTIPRGKKSASKAKNN